MGPHLSYLPVHTEFYQSKEERKRCAPCRREHSYLVERNKTMPGGNMSEDPELEAQTTHFSELVKTGTPQTIQTAIDDGANVNEQDRNGKTPLMCAAMENPNPAVILT